MEERGVVHTQGNDSDWHTLTNPFRSGLRRTSRMMTPSLVVSSCWRTCGAIIPEVKPTIDLPWTEQSRMGFNCRK